MSGADRSRALEQSHPRRRRRPPGADGSDRSAVRYTARTQRCTRTARTSRRHRRRTPATRSRRSRRPRSPAPCRAPPIHPPREAVGPSRAVQGLGPGVEHAKGSTYRLRSRRRSQHARETGPGRGERSSAGWLSLAAICAGPLKPLTSTSRNDATNAKPTLLTLTVGALADDPTNLSVPIRQANATTSQTNERQVSRVGLIR